MSIHSKRRPLYVIEGVLKECVLITVGALLCVGVTLSASAEEDYKALVTGGMDANDARLATYKGTFTVITEMFISLQSEPTAPIVSGASDIVAHFSPPLTLQTEVFSIEACFPGIRIKKEFRDGEGTEGALVASSEDVWNGQALWRISPTGSSGQPGSIYMTTSEPGPSVGLVPIYVALYPFHQKRSEHFGNNQFTWLGFENIADIQTWAVELTPSDERFSDHHRRIWLDPKRGCIPLREEQYVGNSDIPVYRITYDDITAYGQLWLPLSLTREVFDRQGKIVARSRATTTTLEVNIPIGNRVFEVIPATYPAGTLYYNDDLHTGLVITDMLGTE